MQPGCKADATLMLVGEQGIGKSEKSPMVDTYIEGRLANGARPRHPSMGTEAGMTVSVDSAQNLIGDSRINLRRY
jgi:hypothetical protein